MVWVIWQKQYVPIFFDLDNDIDFIMISVHLTSVLILYIKLKKSVYKKFQENNHLTLNNRPYILCLERFIQFLSEVTQQAHWIIISYPGYCVLQHT